MFAGCSAQGALFSVSGRPSAHNAWKAGALVDVAQSHVDYTAYFRNDDSALGGPDQTEMLAGQDITNIVLAGAYVQDKITMGKWIVFPGARVDFERAGFEQSDAPSLFLLGPSTRLGLSYSANDDVVVHSFVGYLWQPPSTLDGPVAARVLIPSLAGQSLPVDVKAEKDWTAELGVSDRLGAHSR